MKKLLSILVAAIMVMSLAVVAFADVDVADTYNNSTSYDIAVVDMPNALGADGESVTVRIKGTSDANFRVYLGNGTGYPGRASDIQMVEVTDGAFDCEFTLTVDSSFEGHSAADCFVIKGASYGLDVPSITWESFVVVGVDAAVETPAEEVENTDTPADTTENTDTAEETTPVENEPANTGIALAVVPMMIAAAAIVVSKRR